MSEFIDVQDIAIRNRIAVDGRVNPTVEDWNNLLTHIDRLEQENAELKGLNAAYRLAYDLEKLTGEELQIFKVENKETIGKLFKLLNK